MGGNLFKSWMRRVIVGLGVMLALIGLAFVSVAILMELGWTNNWGIVDVNSRYLADNQTLKPASSKQEPAIDCRWRAWGALDPEGASQILNHWRRYPAQQIWEQQLSYFHNRVSKRQDYQQYYHWCQQNKHLVSIKPQWSQQEEWQSLKLSLQAESQLITKIGEQLGVSPRLIMAIVAVEQLRLFHSEREIFKQVFKPLGILGVQSQFSLGVSGIKYETAVAIEQHLKTADSPFFPGDKWSTLITYPQGDDQEAVRFARLTDAKDHTFSYLYTGLYLQEVAAQWRRAGQNIDQQVGILATLFNLGFNLSQPKTSAKVGGASIEIAGQTYSFGGLAEEIFYSEFLLDEFPASWPLVKP